MSTPCKFHSVQVAICAMMEKTATIVAVTIVFAAIDSLWALRRK